MKDKASKEVKEVIVEEAPVEIPVSDKGRKARWEAHLDLYKARNPVKFATKEANGEFKDIPASFK